MVNHWTEVLKSAKGKPDVQSIVLVMYYGLQKCSIKIRWKYTTCDSTINMCPWFPPRKSHNIQKLEILCSNIYKSNTLKNNDFLYIGLLIKNKNGKQSCSVKNKTPKNKISKNIKINLYWGPQKTFLYSQFSQPRRALFSTEILYNERKIFQINLQSTYLMHSMSI